MLDGLIAVAGFGFIDLITHGVTRVVTLCGHMLFGGLLMERHMQQELNFITRMMIHYVTTLTILSRSQIRSTKNFTDQGT